jgi:hypothetical protein
MSVSEMRSRCADRFLYSYSPRIQATVYTHLSINLKMLHLAPLLPPSPEGAPYPPFWGEQDF